MQPVSHQLIAVIYISMQPLKLMNNSITVIYLCMLWRLTTRTAHASPPLHVLHDD
jgi:hypothetical protein